MCNSYHLAAFIQPFCAPSPSLWIAFPLKSRLPKGSFSTITFHVNTVLGDNHITHGTSQLTAQLTLILHSLGVMLADMEN